MPTWSEEELEDYVWEHPEFLCIEGYRHLGRQVELPNGQIMDILGIQDAPDSSQLVVTELKAGTADGNGLVQLVNYMVALRGCGGNGDSTGAIWSFPSDLTVMGLLVAPDISPRTIMTVKYMRAHGLAVAIRFAKFHWKSTFVCQEWLEREYAQEPDGELLDYINQAYASADENDDEDEAVREAVDAIEEE